MSTRERFDEDLKRALAPGNDRGPVRRLTLEAFGREDIRALREPIVVTGLVDTWPAKERWTLDHLRAAIGEELVNVGTLPEDHVNRYDAAKNVPFGELCDALASSPPRERWYLAAARVWSKRTQARGPFTALADDVPAPPLVTAAMLDSIHMWIGYDGVASNLHYDLGDNLLSMIRGTKHALVFAPEERRNLYPFSPFSDRYCFHSQVGFRGLDPARFPALRQARYWRVTIGPGETLFLPRLFWHYVVSEGLNIAVNSWFELAPPKPLEGLRSPLRQIALQDQLRALKRRVRRLRG